jgi:pimeloyl-ACP methyl ester carboxylesterase
MEADARWIAPMLGESAHLIGHSFGGAEALLAAALRPAAVRSLILVEPALQPLFMTDPAATQVPAVKADLDRTMGALMAARSPGEYGLAFARSLGTATGGGGTNDAAARLEADPEKATRLGCALLQAGIASPPAMQRAAEAVAQAGIPVLVVTGGWSASTDALGALVAKLTRGQHTVVQSPNHFVQVASAVEFNKVASAFMREADRGRG